MFGIRLNRSVLNLFRNANKQAKYFIKNYNERFNDDSLETDENYEYLANKCFISKEQNCYIIHPYIKWGPKKKRDISVGNEINEAVSLVNTLVGWKVANTNIIPVDNFDKKFIFGSGTLEKLKQEIRSQSMLTSVFINTGTLKNKQINELEVIFGVPIFDRYKIVMQILRQHAISKHAKLQVALAEIPYLRSRLKYIDIGTSTNWKVRDKMLQEREHKLKNELKKLRNQRELLRNKRRDLNFPVIAVVGYTNVGKTSLIKCLTGDKNLIPRNQLFATLDVTVHAGLLPSNLEVLYVDTVGFISDIPTDLIECFIATLEDAILADVILHIEDVSNENMEYQRKHVNTVLESLSKRIGKENLQEKLIYVGNKSDIAIKNISKENMLLVSTKTLLGLDILKQKIEEIVLKSTGRERIFIRIPNGGDEMRWLYKNSTVIGLEEDKNDSQLQIMNVIITQSKLKQFHSYFAKIAKSNRK